MRRTVIFVLLCAAGTFAFSQDGEELVQENLVAVGIQPSGGGEEAILQGSGGYEAPARGIRPMGENEARYNFDTIGDRMPGEFFLGVVGKLFSSAYVLDYSNLADFIGGRSGSVFAPIPWPFNLGFNLGVAVNFHRNWAWEIVYEVAYYLGETETTSINLQFGDSALRSGFRFITAFDSAVNFLARIAIGTGFPTYFSTGAGLGMRITPGLRWFIDISADYYWGRSLFAPPTGVHAFVPRINAGFRW